jgi:hypothetical protein
MNKKFPFIIVSLIIIAFLIIYSFNTSYPSEESPEKAKINGLIMLIEFEGIDGVLHWEKALDQNNIRALIKAQENVLEEYPEVFKRLADKGYEIAGGYDEAPFWDMAYEEQYDLMKKAKETIECITEKPMRVFGSRYFAYDENTLKAADDLDIQYILARGTAGEEAVVYAPEEYRVKIISVSNVPFEEMGKGSLCDYSLWARGATPEDFGEVLDWCLNNKPKDMILVSHAYLGGTRLAWWEQYEKALRSDKVMWRTNFDEWLKNLDVIEMPFSEIPQNREVQYTAPKPAKAIEDYEPIPGLEEYQESTTKKEEIELKCF